MTDNATGRILIDLFTTLDGVAQAPGAPEEDREGGFVYGGWQAPVFDEGVGQTISEGMQELDALLLGRKTYDIFAGFWPDKEDTPDGDIARLFNRVPKYVASRGAPALEWAGTTQIGDDLANQIRELRTRHSQIHVMGSIDFVQTLLAEQLFDELKLWVHPVVLGQGKKVFPDGATPANLRLIEPPFTSPTGALLLRYAPAPGKPGTGDLSSG